MPTRNVVLTDRQEALIDALVTSGRYQNASEVLRDGLRLLEHREAEQAAKLAAMQDAVRVGLGDLANYCFMEFETPQALRAHLRGLMARALGIKRAA